MTLSSRCTELQSSLELQSLNSLADYSYLGSNTLRDKFASNGWDVENYDALITQSSGPWLVIAALALALYIIFVINAIWLRNCPHKAKGMWECCRLPRGTQHTKLLMAIGLLLTAGALGGSIAGVFLGQSNRDTGDQAACAMLDFFGRVKNGSLSEKWAGTNESMFSYQQVASKLTSDVNAISTSFSTDATQMNLKVADYKSDLVLLNTNKGNYHVKSAKYGSHQTVIPTFISELSSMHIESLKTEIETLAGVVSSHAQGLHDEVSDLKTKVATYQTSATNALTYYSVFGKAMATISQTMVDYIHENYQFWVNISTGIKISFYVCIGLTAAIILSIFYHHVRRSQIALQIAYIGWNFLMLWTIVNGVFASQMQELRKRTSEHCDVFNLVAGNQGYIDRLANQYTVEFPAILKTCFFSDGDTYKAVDFEDAGLQLGKIATYLREVEPFVVDGPGSIQIATQKKIIDMYIQGLILAVPDELNAEGTQYNLDLLNSLSNSNLSDSRQKIDASCTISNDMWVLNLTNCSTTTPPFSPAYGPDDYFGKNICLAIRSLDSETINQRYKDSNFPHCSQVLGASLATKLVETYKGLNVHFEDTRMKFGQLKEFYDYNLNFKYNEALQGASSLTQPIQEFNSSFSSFLEYVTTPNNGILNISNCAFFRPRLLSANTYLCDTASNIQKTFIVHVASVICGVVGCAFVYLYLRKLEGTFKFIDVDDSDDELEEINNTPIPRELRNINTHTLDATGHDRILDVSEI